MNKVLKKTRRLLTAPILIVLGLLGFGLYHKHNGVKRHVKSIVEMEQDIRDMPNKYW